MLIRAGKHPTRQLTKASIGRRPMPRKLAKDGGTAKSPPPSIPASTPLPGPASNWWKKASMPCLSASIRQPRPDRASLTAPPKPKLIALACSKPPTGRKRWTLQLLEEQVVELKIVDRAKRQHDQADAQAISGRICRSNGSSHRMPTPRS